MTIGERLPNLGERLDGLGLVSVLNENGLGLGGWMGNVVLVKEGSDDRETVVERLGIEQDEETVMGNLGRELTECLTNIIGKQQLLINLFHHLGFEVLRG